LRIEHYEQTRKILTQEGDSVSTTNTEVLPGIGATYQVAPNAQIYGGVYRAFAPATNGAALDGLTDQRLDAERSDNFELGMRGLAGGLGYDLAVFRMQFDNQVVTGNSDPNLSQSNAGETLHQGVEVALDHELGAGFRISGNLTYVPIARFESGSNDGNRVPYSPKWLANVALEYGWRDLEVALMGHHRGAHLGDETNLRDIPADAAGGIWGGRLPGYTLFDFTARYRASEQLSVFGAVKNLTDKRYITGLRQGIYVGPERSFEIGARYLL
jgi:Fe(3+) dicitrate transport protein